MAEPDWNPDTGGRSLAEILREAGIESANRAARRRTWDDPEETGIRQRRAEAAAADGAAGRTGYGRRRSDLDEPDRPDFSAPPPGLERRRQPERRQTRRAPDPSTAAIPGLRPDRKPGVPAGGPMPSAPIPSAPVPSAPVSGAPAPREALHSQPVPALDRRAGRPIPQRGSSRAAREAEHPSTGPIPVVRAGDGEGLDDDLDATPQESALAWLRFAGELVIALVAGVAVYFAATVLWEIVPHVAVLLAPLAVTGLVAGVGVWRQKQGREPIGARLLAVLVFAGTLLTIAPAAGLLAAGS
ncbi:hypothetical protein [Blastococcus tunisiensis]|uniref:Uncharacterized protein n=1 Tax=Blastococcus tunisiensis TaxID=1798228 RepID=A0A1I1VT01_9ACTN|nr:hypothetical protein [Blastococcus sp. DSM 46838]SFD86212.1 hypothetical protein SAMN05216574_10198 [Blastococcus sp. DSM 46838]